MKKTSFNNRLVSSNRIVVLACSAAMFLAVVGSVLIWPWATTLSKSLRRALSASTPTSAIPVQSQTTFYLHGTGAANNPPTLFLNTTAPTASTEKFKDSSSVTRNGGNVWKEVGTWPATADLTSGSLVSLSDLHVWLGLKNSDDQGTYFDLRVEAYKNSTLVATGQSLCITGITRNAADAKQVTLSFDPFSAVTFNGTSDLLNLKVLTRVGTDASGGSCGGHNSATGLRLYFDAVSRSSRFNATLGTSDITPPLLSVSEPVPGLLTNLSQILVKGTYSDASPVTISVNGVSATLSGGNFTASVTLAEGLNNLNVVATDAFGNQNTASVNVTRDSTPPVVTIDHPADGAVLTASLLTITGTLSDSHKGTITINNDLTIVPKITGDQFSMSFTLTEGPNTLTLHGIDQAGNTTDVVRSVVYHIDHTPPVLVVSEPLEGAASQAFLVRGTVSTVNPPVTVKVNDHATSLNLDGTFAGGVSLPEGNNQIRIQAIDANNNVTTVTRTVKVDTIAPTISDVTPAAGTVIDATSVSIQARVTDSTAVTVTVNGVAASAGANNIFTAQVPISEGESEFVITAKDAATNSSRSTLLLIGKDKTPPVAPEVFAPTTPTRLDFQTIEGRAESGSRVTITGGMQPVTVDAAFGTGLFAAVVNLNSGSHPLTVTAADSSSNVSPATQVSITSDPGMALPAAGLPAQINISSGNSQRGLINTELPRPVIVIVTDRNGAPVSGVVVHFTIKQGGGRFIDGSAAADATTDAGGRASARYISGAVTGIQLIRADYTGNALTPATFTAEALETTTSGVTSVSGVVQDQNLRALPNVLVRISGQQTRTGADGRFVFTNVSTGPHQLLELIGRDQVALPGRWPNISYDFDVLPGINNDLGRPLFLPKVNDGVSMPLDANNVVTQDTTFELPVVGGEPPIRVTAKAGTHIIFPPDVTDKRLSVTRLATSRTPMVLEDGRATNLYVSVQPSGAIFETPLEVSFPNLDKLPAGKQVLMMSFDHDVGRYVTVGSGHVTADGKSVKSDPGSGVRVGAWQALPPPEPQVEVTVLGHIQMAGNPAFEGKVVRVNEAWVEGQRAQLVTASNSAPRWDYRATLTVPQNTLRSAKMEATVVATPLSLEIEPLVPPNQATAAAGPNVSVLKTAALVTAQSQSSVHVIMAPGQTVFAGATANPGPAPGESYSYAWESNDEDIAVAGFQPGTNAQNHPSQGSIKGVAPGHTTVTVTFTWKCQSCWFSRSPTVDFDVTVIGVNSLEAELASTKNPITGATRDAGRFSTTNRDLAFVPTAGNDLMVVMQNAGPVTIKAIGLNPTSLTDRIRWQVERNPQDTIDTDLPDFADSETGQLTLTPNKPGNFRVVCFVNTYQDNHRYQDAELKVLRVAIVRLTPQPQDSFISAPNLGYSDNVIDANFTRLDSSDAMLIRGNVLVEGGGPDRMVGVNKVQLAFAGNALADDIVITYGVPAPTPAPPGNVVGIGREALGISFPLVDSNAENPSTADPGQPNQKFTRFTSNVAVSGSGPNGGQIIILEASDDPSLALRTRHPTTSNPWTQIRGGNNFRETLIAFSVDFGLNFVAIGRGDWRITFDGDNGPSGWEGKGANVFLQGTTTGTKQPLTFVTQQPADTFGLQTYGPSFKKSLQNLGNGGVVYSP